MGLTLALCVVFILNTASRPEGAAPTQQDTGDTSSLAYDDIDEEVSVTHDTQPRSISPQPAAKSGHTGNYLSQSDTLVIISANQTHW